MGLDNWLGKQEEEINNLKITTIRDVKTSHLAILKQERIIFKKLENNVCSEGYVCTKGHNSC